MNNPDTYRKLKPLATALVMVAIVASVNGCSSVTTGQTDHCIEQANNADVHGVSTADEQLNACLETYQMRRNEERTFGEALAEEVLISVIDIITD